jgi:hypothetical protein
VQTGVYLNLYCFPRSGLYLERNYNAFLFAIVAEREYTVEECFEAVVSNRLPGTNEKITTHSLREAEGKKRKKGREPIEDEAEI